MSLLLLPCHAVPDAAKAKEERKALQEGLFPLLRQADRVVIYSLYPVEKEYLEGPLGQYESQAAFGVDRDEGVKAPSETDKKVAAFAREAELFEGFPVLGKIEFKGAKETPALLKEIRGSMLTKEESSGDEDCFEPHHGILVVKGDRQLRFVLCFLCDQSRISGEPELDEKAVEAFDHFKEEFGDYLDAQFAKAKVVHPPYKDFPPPDPK